MQKRHVTEINGTEMMYQMKWASKPYHCVVLATVKDGCSFKPYFPDDSDSEKKSLINEYVTAGMTYKQAKTKIEDPTYCFLHAHSAMPIKELRQVIKNGNTGSFATTGKDPVCPLA